MGHRLQQPVSLVTVVSKGCEIPNKQNVERGLQLIAAWSHLYRKAKVIAGWQFTLSVPVALTLSLIALRWPNAKLVTTPLSLLFGWIDMLWLDPIQEERKKLGARVQEQFDCELFDLPWNGVRCGSLPPTEAVNEAAEIGRKLTETSRLRNWYPSEVGRLPISFARLICQRAAVWWDMSQRRTYAAWLVGIIAVLIVSIVAFSFTVDQRVRDMILSVYLPLAPAVIWVVRESRRQRDAYRGLEKLREQIESFFEAAIVGTHDTSQLAPFSRSVQDMIFDGRSRNPLFFDFIYKRLRKQHELRMNEKAKELVERALAAQGLWKL
ncbi:MAG: S-4TM family putative pore-forming effector [Acidobacteriota bacterium]